MASITPQETPQATPTADPTPSLAATPTGQTTPLVEATPTASPTATADADGWIGPQLVSNRPYGDLSLVIDESGTAHAAAVLNDSIFYLTNETGSWTRERLTRPAGYDWDPAIALDTDGSLHVAFTRWPPDDPNYCPPDIADCFGPGPEGVYYTTNSSGSWSAAIRLGRTGGNSPSLQVRDGKLHLAYLGRLVVGELSGPGPVRYRTNGGGTWSDERVGTSYGSPVLSLGSDGKARLAFWDVDEDDEAELYEPRWWFGVADPPAGSVGLEQLRGAPAAGWIGNMWMDLDGTDAPHLLADIWNGEGGADATYHWSMQGAAWGTPRAVLPSEVGRSMAVGADGTLHLLATEYEAQSGEHCCMHYAALRSGVIEKRNLSPLGGGGDIALDEQGRPHVLFVVRDADGRSSELWYAIGPDR